MLTGLGDGSADLGVRAGMATKDPRHYPAPGSTLANGPAGSIFHPALAICSPWNRLAYRTHGGVHENWPSTTDWKRTATEYTQAHTIADMLSALHLHLRSSPGMAAA
jgi:hypothetical protein